MRGRPIPPLKITAAEREALERWARGHDRRLASRASAILSSADGVSNKDVAARCGMTKQTVGKWRTRFRANRLQGLHDEPRPGAPRRITDEQVARVLRLAGERAPNGAAWTTRSMAQAVGLTQTAISRIWRTHGVRPAATGNGGARWRPRGPAGPAPRPSPDPGARRRQPRARAPSPPSTTSCATRTRCAGHARRSWTRCSRSPSTRSSGPSRSTASPCAPATRARRCPCATPATSWTRRRRRPATWSAAWPTARRRPRGRGRDPRRGRGLRGRGRAGVSELRDRSPRAGGWRVTTRLPCPGRGAASPSAGPQERGAPPARGGDRFSRPAGAIDRRATSRPAG